MTSILELENALAGIFANDQERDVQAADDIAVSVDVREIRTDLVVLAAARDSGN